MSRWSGGEFTKRPISNLTVDPVFGWSAPYHSCWAWARPAIISPSPATDWPDCGHPFVSFQMTIKMGRRARTGGLEIVKHFGPTWLAWYWKPSSPPITNSPQTAFLLVIHYCPGGWFPQCNLGHFPSKTKQNSCFRQTFHSYFYKKGNANRNSGLSFLRYWTPTILLTVMQTTE